MKKILFLLSVLFLIRTADAGNGALLFYHETPQGIVQGEKVNIEVQMNSAATGFYDMRLYYRQVGDLKFRSENMVRDGYLYSASLNTTEFPAGQIEYYIAYEGPLGALGSLPDAQPEMDPYIMTLAPAEAMQSGEPFEVIILSPEPEQIVPKDELIIAATIIGLSEEIDYEKTMLFIDGVNVSSLATIEDGVLIFAPEQIREGRHNVEMNLYGTSGEMVGTKEWSFRAEGGSSENAGQKIRGSVFMENRYQNIAETGTNYFRGGGDSYGNFGDLDYRARILFSSEESGDRQPVNRYTAYLKYNFSDWNNIYLNGGDLTPFYNSLVLQDKRVRGLQAGLAIGFFTFDYVYGETYRAVEGSVDNTTFPGQEFIQNGTYSESLMAIRPGFRFGEHVAWNLNLVNAKEDAESIKYGGNARESLIAGTDLNMNFDRQRILISASVQASIKNTDAGGDEVTFDDLVELDSSLADDATAEKLFNILDNSGFLSITSGLSPLPSLAMEFETTLRYFKNNIRFRYYDISKEFASPGNPYLLKDVAGFGIVDNIRLFDNRVFLNLFYRGYQNNVSEEDLATQNNELGANISYFPGSSMPSFTVGYSSINRQNNVTAADTVGNEFLFMEDNSTNRLSLSSSYNVLVSNVRNTISLNYTSYVRDEMINKENQSDFNMFGIGVNSSFTIPLRTRVNFSQSESVYGETSKSTTSVQRFHVGVDYIFENLPQGSELKPFVKLTFQSIDTESFGVKNSSTRNSYAGGLTYKHPKIGVFTMRYDQIQYSLVDYSDSIVNARYEYNF
jgi:hypothetical protein